MFEEDCGRDTGGAQSWCPYFPAAVVLVGCADDIPLGAVLGKRFAAVGFVVDKGFHAQGDERVCVVVMMTVEMRMGGNVGVCIGLP